jgi:hypothetical protein
MSREFTTSPAKELQFSGVRLPRAHPRGMLSIGALAPNLSRHQLKNTLGNPKAEETRSPPVGTLELAQLRVSSQMSKR